MRILIKYMELGLMKKFELYDMEEKLLYKAKIDNKSMHRRVILSDAEDNVLGKSQLVTSSYITKSSMTDADEGYIDEITYKTGFHPKYISSEYGYTAEGDFSKWKYKVTDESGEWIFKVSTDNPKDRKYYSMDVKDDADIRYCCHLMLSIVAMESLRLN